MNKKVLTAQQLSAFRIWLVEEEKSSATIDKYCRDVRAFLAWAGDCAIDKTVTVAYKQTLQEKGYALRSINSMLASLNTLFTFLGWQECKVKPLRCQRQTYCDQGQELTKGEYLRLLEAARNRPQLCMVLQTICATGIRVSELRYFTLEAVRRGEISVRCKSKTRTILIPKQLRNRLLQYAGERRIRSGTIFVTRSGNPLDRSNIWSQMKKLCAVAGVNPQKVFPHNLRKLFARTFYNMEKDLAKLADILGHGSVETTRIYIMTTGTEHRKKLDRLGLIL